jgi:hypothetical protein
MLRLCLIPKLFAIADEVFSLALRACALRNPLRIISVQLEFQGAALTLGETELMYLVALLRVSFKILLQVLWVDTNPPFA